MTSYQTNASITGYRITTTPAGPAVDIYVVGAPPNNQQQQWHLDPEDVLPMLAAAAQAIRDASNPPDLALLLRSSMITALSNVLIAKGWWAAGA